MRYIMAIFFFCTQMAFAKTIVAKINKIANSSHPKAPMIVTKYLVRQKFYFAGIPWAKKVLLGKKEMITSKFDKDLDRIITATGFASFQKMDSKILARSKAPAISFILARKSFDRKNYKTALTWIKKIPGHHKYYPEAIYMKGSILSLLGQDEKSIEAYNHCIEQSKKFVSKSKNEKVSRFFRVIGEKCVLNIARQHYEKKRFAKAIKRYDSIPKTSYIWPYVLMEKSWSYYNQKNYNRALGVLTTYKAPLMESYFFPEAEVLSGLSYLNMCLWTDTLTVVKKFHKDYAPQSKSLAKLLRKHKNSSDYFFNLMFAENEKEKSKNPYIRKLLTQIKKKIYFNFQLKYHRQSLKEIESLKKWSEHKFINDLVAKVTKEKKEVATRINDYIKEKMYFFINETNRLSEEMYNIQLELLSRKKEIIYASKKEIADRSRGSFKNVERTRFQHFWKFKGGFWADELGDFVFGLESNCKEGSNG